METLLNREPHTIDEVAYAGTALHSAALNGQVAVAKLLLEKDMDYSILDADGWTAAEIAEQKGHEDLARVISQYRTPILAETLRQADELASLREAGALKEYQYQPLPIGANHVLDSWLWILQIRMVK